MAWIVEPRQIADKDGNPTGKWRLTVCSDEDGGGPYGCLDCCHDTPEEAMACEKCDAVVSGFTGFPSQKRLKEVELRARAWEDIGKERLRQIDREGFSPESDDGYLDGELLRAAACYLLNLVVPKSPHRWPGLWPWPSLWWKPTNPRRDLVKAGALILAEIERLDRAAAKGSSCPDT